MPGCSPPDPSMLNTAWLQAKLDPSKVAPEVPTEMAPANETIERGNMSKDKFEKLEKDFKEVKALKEKADMARDAQGDESKVCLFLKSKTVYC